MGKGTLEQNGDPKPRGKLAGFLGRRERPGDSKSLTFTFHPALRTDLRIEDGRFEQEVAPI